MAQVLKPNKAYKGQKLTKLVRTNIPAAIKRIIPKVPEMIFEKKRMRMMTAIETLRTRSAVPILVFILKEF